MRFITTRRPVPGSLEHNVDQWPPLVNASGRSAKLARSSHEKRLEGAIGAHDLVRESGLFSNPDGVGVFWIKNAGCSIELQSFICPFQHPCNGLGGVAFTLFVRFEHPACLRISTQGRRRIASVAGKPNLSKEYAGILAFNDPISKAEMLPVTSIAQKSSPRLHFGGWLV